MINGFTLDGMHTVYLGCLKRLLSFFKGSKTSNRTNKYISERAFYTMGKLYSSFKFPWEFTRRPRDFSHIANWKATEYRMFLLYGFDVVVRRTTLPKDLISVCQMLAIAVRILSDSELYLARNQLASNLIESFVATTITFFGSHFITLMMHCLTHLPAECKANGPLDSFSCFKYENALKSIKSRCRSHSAPLLSLATQLQFQSNLVSNSQKPVGAQVEGAAKASQSDNALTRTLVPVGQQFRYVRCKNFKLSDYAPNCYFSPKNKAQVYEIHGIVSQKTGIVLVCYLWDTEPAYYVPTSDESIRLNSSITGVFRLKARAVDPTVLNVKDVYRKCIVNSVDGLLFSWPLL